MSRGGFTRLVIFDITGKEITALVNEEEDAGTYEVSWDGSNYPSGVYFCELTTEGFTQTRKMALIK